MGKCVGKCEGLLAVHLPEAQGQAQRQTLLEMKSLLWAHSYKRVHCNQHLFLFCREVVVARVGTRWLLW